MNQGTCMTEQAVSTAHLPPMERSPLECSYGMFIADSAAHGGAQGFCWFETESDALTYLRGELPELYEDGADDSSLRVALAAALEGVTALKCFSRDRVNAAAEGVFELRWRGSLDDLRLGNEPFEEDIQRDYHDNVFGEERGFAESDLEDFATHLEHYQE